jgi:hypothetical protein
MAQQDPTRDNIACLHDTHVARESSALKKPSTSMPDIHTRMYATIRSHQPDKLNRVTLRSRTSIQVLA